MAVDMDNPFLIPEENGNNDNFGSDATLPPRQLFEMDSGGNSLYGKHEPVPPPGTIISSMQPGLQFDSQSDYPAITQSQEKQIDPEFKKQDRKYVISDLYWLTNLNNNRINNEVEVLVIGFNADFENLRLSFSNRDTSSEHIALPPGSKINSVNMFSETCRSILYQVELLSKGQPPQNPIIITNYERIQSIKGNPGWEPNQTKIVIQNKEIHIHTKLPSGEIKVFRLIDWQVGAFLECCKFMVNGNSWMSKLYSCAAK